MKLKFKQQAYQTDAVKAVVGCFAGQPKSQGFKYAIDPGRAAAGGSMALAGLESGGFANDKIALPPSQLLENLRGVQQRQNLTLSPELKKTPVCDVNLDIEMETGTGKTYCYIKTMFELSRDYGWRKFIVVVPSIAIREGVLKSFEIMAEHFLEQYGTVGEQKDEAKYEEMKNGDAFVAKQNETDYLATTASSVVRYDVIGKLTESTQLTRRTIATILRGVNTAVFSQFKTNPEDFLLKAGTVINEQKATVIVEHLAYNPLEETHAIDIFTQEKKEDLSKGFKATRHIYDYVFTDSANERTFVGELDASAEVVVYAKLPRSFHIPTPVGNYNPDWAIAFQSGKVKHVFFVAETKGSMSSMDLRKIEEAKIDCARKFFAKITSEQVKYDVVTNYGKLMELVK